MADIEKIKDLLGSGLSNEVVANATGVSPSYVSQLMSNPEFASEIASKRSAILTANSARDREIDSIEDDLIVILKDQVSNGLFYKPREILQAFSIINRATRRGVINPSGANQGSVVVNLNLPTVVVKNFTVNAQSEVVEIDGQSMVTMPSSQLLRELASKSGSEGTNDKYTEVSKYLKSTDGTNESPQLLTARSIATLRASQLAAEAAGSISADYSEVTVETGRTKV